MPKHQETIESELEPISTPTKDDAEGITTLRILNPKALRGMVAKPSTPETDSDPRNPNHR